MKGWVPMDEGCIMGEASKVSALEAVPPRQEGSPERNSCASLTFAQQHSEAPAHLQWLQDRVAQLEAQLHTLGHEPSSSHVPTASMQAALQLGGQSLCSGVQDVPES